ncbi:hypothetical protein TKK_0013648 [Trichogramma kaykai]
MSKNTSDESSEDEFDEEELQRNFDDEASLIVQTDTLPKKSSERYLLVYDAYKDWQKEHAKSLSNSEEKNLIVYFSELKLKLKPTTLWSIWSMLKKTLATRDDVNINNFITLKSLIKNNSKGLLNLLREPTKSAVLKWDEIKKFMDEAPDFVYLGTKVVLVFGICGALRSDEIKNMLVQDVEDLNNKYLVSINVNKNDYPGRFIIGNLFYDKVKQYIDARPTDFGENRFFIQFSKGKCTRQPMGRHKIGQVPAMIAEFLGLQNPKAYTGHCFRRTAATLLSESGANMQMIKQMGRWRSDLIAQGYIENSLLNKQLIFNGIVQSVRKSPITSHFDESTSSIPCMSMTTSKNHCIQENITVPSTSNCEQLNAGQICVPSSCASEIDILELDLQWKDFADDFESNNNQISGTENFGTDFVTGKKKIIKTIQPSGSISGNRTTFHQKSPVKIIFNKSSQIQPPAKKNETNKRE